MCSIIVINHHHKTFPLVIAANRDEDFNRPSYPVQILSKEPHLTMGGKKEPHLIMGGKDELKGGTWLAVNNNSLFAAITNQESNHRNPKLETRGSIVYNALRCKSIDEMLHFVENLNPSKYNKFNLVFGNNKVVFIAHSYLLHSMVIRELPPGIHTIFSDMRFVGEMPAGQYIHRKLDNIKDMPWLEYYKVLKKVLANAENGVKIKPKKTQEGTIGGHCTRSSSILAFSEEGLIRYKFHDRTAPRKKPKERKEGEPFVPRYKDYIDIWRNPDNPVNSEANVSEEDGDVDEEKAAESEFAKKIREILKVKMRETNYDYRGYGYGDDEIY